MTKIIFKYFKRVYNHKKYLIQNKLTSTAITHKLLTGVLSRFTSRGTLLLSVSVVLPGITVLGGLNEGQS